MAKKFAKQEKGHAQKFFFFPFPFSFSLVVLLSGLGYVVARVELRKGVAMWSDMHEDAFMIKSESEGHIFSSLWVLHYLYMLLMNF